MAKYRVTLQGPAGAERSIWLRMGPARPETAKLVAGEPIELDLTARQAAGLAAKPWAVVEAVEPPVKRTKGGE